jgi:hypothetical protein
VGRLGLDLDRHLHVAQVGRGRLDDGDRERQPMPGRLEPACLHVADRLEDAIRGPLELVDRPLHRRPEAAGGVEHARQHLLRRAGQGLEVDEGGAGDLPQPEPLGARELDAVGGAPGLEGLEVELHRLAFGGVDAGLFEARHQDADLLPALVGGPIVDREVADRVRADPRLLAALEQVDGPVARRALELQDERARVRRGGTLRGSAAGGLPVAALHVPFHRPSITVP